LKNIMTWRAFLKAAKEGPKGLREGSRVASGEGGPTGKRNKEGESVSKGRASPRFQFLGGERGGKQKKDVWATGGWKGPENNLVKALEKLKTFL